MADGVWGYIYAHVCVGGVCARIEDAENRKFGRGPGPYCELKRTRANEQERLFGNIGPVFLVLFFRIGVMGL